MSQSLYLRAGRVVVRFPAEVKIFLFTAFRPTLGPHPASCPMGTPVSSGVRRPGCEADHSLPSSAEVKNGGAVPPVPHMSSWRGAQLIKRRDNLVFICTGFELSAHPTWTQQQSTLCV
jgi:hypothetical protein